MRLSRALATHAASLPSVQLRSGAAMPMAIMGTYVGNATGHTSARDAPALVEAALRVGFTHFDTALMYQNEAELGAALRQGAASVPAELFVTTKVAHPNDENRGHTACSYMHDPDSCAIEGAHRNVSECVARLGLGRPIDMVLLHWPGQFRSADGVFNEQKRWEMWQGLERALDEGLCSAIGLSNFTVKHVEQLCERGPSVMPAVNQVQANPLCTNRAVTTLCQSLGMAVTGWSPLRVGDLSVPVLEQLAAKYGTTPAAITLRWLVQRGVAPIPRSTNPERIAANYAAVVAPTFALTEEELAAVDACDTGESVFPNADPEDIA